MDDIGKYLIKTKIMIFFEVILLFSAIIFYLLLKNVLIGIYLGLFIISVFSWLILLLVTVNLYNKAKSRKRDNFLER
jgi:high-affinity Fe2+/Pb2+ permease